MSLWREYIRAVSEALDLPRPLASVACTMPLLMLLVALARTWFLWVAIIAASVMILGVLLVVEYSLRAWYAICDGPRQESRKLRPLAQASVVPKRPAVACADIQGRIGRSDLRGYDVNAMAQHILQNACIQETPSVLPSWLRFPAISRAAPWLAQAWQLVREVVTS